MSEAEIVQTFLFLTGKFKAVGYSFVAYGKNDGFMAHGGGGFMHRAKTYKFRNLQEAEEKLNELEK